MLSVKSSDRVQRWWSAVIVAASIVLFVIAGVRLAAWQSVTVDEPGHLGAGLSYWVRNDFTVSTGNFYFTQKWAAWPLVRSAGNYSRLQHLPPEIGNPHAIGEWFLFSSGKVPQEALFSARCMTLALAVALVLLVAIWAFQIGGWWAAAFAAILFVTNPVNLAHGVLVTADTGAALWWVLALFLYDRLLRAPNVTLAIATGASLGMLLLSKFTLPYWLLVASAVLAWHVTANRASLNLTRLFGLYALAAVCAGMIVWLFFGFRYEATDGAFHFPAATTGLAHFVAVAARWRLLPAPFLRELMVVPSMLQPRPSFLFGEYRVGTHWLYFPFAFLAKNTLASLLALSVWVSIRRRNQAGVDDRRIKAPTVAIGIVVLLIAGIFTPLNIGVRHVLPVFSLAAIAGGVALAALARRSRISTLASAAIAVLAVAESVSAAGHPTAWFNAAFGGPMAGYRWMNDSSLEWGGDVPDLVAWHEALLPEDRALPIYACVLGPPIFRPYGLPADDLVAAFRRGEVRRGYFIFSATRLYGGIGPCYGKPANDVAAAWRASASASWRERLDTVRAGLAASQLASYCRNEMEPRRIGPVYFAYRLTEADLARALDP